MVLELLKNIKKLQNKGVIMKEIIYLVSLILILGFVIVFTKKGTEVIQENMPIKSSNVLEKEYEKYEMSNYR